MRGEERGRVTPPTTDTTSLLEYLRAEVRAPTLAFAEVPGAISGGYDTRIFSFRLTGAPPAWSGPLILRVLSPKHDPARALRERATQNAVAGLGYPAPRVLSVCAAREPLGAAFLVMERAAGRPLLDAQRLGVSRLLAESHARLHALDPEPLLRALDAEGRAADGAFDRETVGYGAHLAALDRRIRKGPLGGLSKGMAWLLARAPTVSRWAICHGDFHPQNLLVEHGRLAAVLDWPNLVVAEPEYDVASTRVILTCTPIELAAPPALRPLVTVLRPIMVARYLARYRRLARLDPARLPPYEAAACMRGLVRVAEVRTAGSPEISPLDASSFGERLAARFAAITGVAVTLPPRPR
ncbi:MAG TPA: phosphotransferase [Methylomirabilota bacterium]|nr:phosphotransferase [Methylomirabilota bacterium]